MSACQAHLGLGPSSAPESATAAIMGGGYMGSTYMVHVLCTLVRPISSRGTDLRR